MAKLKAVVEGGDRDTIPEDRGMSSGSATQHKQATEPGQTPDWGELTRGTPAPVRWRVGA